MAFSCPASEADFVDQVKSDLNIFLETSSAHRVDASNDERQGSVRTASLSSDLTMVVSDTERTSSQQRKSRTSLPTIGIYRPPAARRSTDDSSKVISPAPDLHSDEPPAKNAVKSARPRVRRPDQQVYVPRAKRVFQDSEKFDDTPAPPGDRSSTRLSSPVRSPPEKDRHTSGSTLIIEDEISSKPRSSSPTISLPPRASQLVETKKKLCQSTSSDLDLEGIRGSISSGSERLSSTMSSSQPKNLPPRAEVLVEKKKMLCHSSSPTEDFQWKTKEEADQDFNRTSDSAVGSEQPATLTDVENKYSRSKSRSSSVISDSGVAPVIDFKVTNTRSVNEVEEKCDIVQVGGSPYQGTQSDKILPKHVSIEAEPSQTVMVESNNHRQLSQRDTESSDDDFRDANLSGRLTNTSSGGSSESLSSSDSVNYVAPVQLMKPVKGEGNKQASPTKAARVFNPDECDWDDLLDEDVLDPFLMKELTSAVGEVQVAHPKSDYRNYRSQVPADQQKTRRSAGDDDFSHVVEIFNFPPEFKTHDLVAVLSPFKNTAGGFEIKWVDDTHALGVFAGALVAEQVLAYQHPMVRMRPLCEASLESRLKARRLSESIHSFRPRPETCAALARRLVTGALGVKLPTARAEREEEKRVLREAREKRRLAVQQQDDIWNS
ncbi:nucleolar protein dao-5 isoform X2 [Thrips palmi]|uniref:Nucleolar protein dao-5 isoform X2 n=1 Tax=Thrips palmi TaxID=161013 RepID=A0A6P8ZIV2_THRPL|nr:nucleolar protein dao-5 isoform X2 [Thrips palmi]